MEKDFYIICALAAVAFFLLAGVGPLCGVKLRYVPWLTAGSMAAVSAAGFRVHWGFGVLFLMLGTALVALVNVGVKQILRDAAAKKAKEAEGEAPEVKDEPDATSHQL